jgi:DNA-binding CsgD family transcriptional regulator
LAPDAVDGRGVAGAAHPTNTGLGRVAEPFLFAVQRASAPRHHKVVPGQQTLTTGQMAKPAAALADVTLHGLRCTAVIRLRRAGLSVGQIGDIAGMSLATIERYCRFADRKTSGQAALVQLTNNAATVKRRRQL